MDRTTVARLNGLGVLRISGADAPRFLQGQLSNDMERLSDAGSLLAGLHTAQGRVVALLRLLRAADASVLAVLPAPLLPRVSARLSGYILRAKVRIEDASAQLAVYGVNRESGRDLQVLPAGSDPPQGLPSDEAQWHADDVAAGLPQVYPATSEAFIAQMLNLDLVEGISFSKGCYTGQEIIARAHYRGRVKRRMQRFVTSQQASPKPGERYRLADGRTIEIVDGAPRSTGGHDVLAVAPLSAAPAVPDAPEAAEAAPTLALLDAQSAPLPYSLES
jgi:folate-binding protein YgfZ